MAQGMTDKRETILVKSEQVKDVARKLAEDIHTFLAPSPKPDDGSPAPILNVLDQIVENLIQTQDALIAASARFAQIKSRIG